MKISEEERRDVIDDENHDEYSGVDDELFGAKHGAEDTKHVKKIIESVNDNTNPASQAGPIVLINIHANGLNLNSADDIAEALQKTLGYKESTIETEKLKVEESEEEKDIPDYVDYADIPTDYIKISMESQFMDQRYCSTQL